MSKKNNHNSIVFLTTLSVYLGLVLVGGTAPVLAHSALTRDFDIKNEIVFEDDLDKNPDDEKIDFSVSLESYFANVDGFLEDLQKLHRIEKFDLNNDKFELNGQLNIPCNVDGDPIGNLNAVSRNIDNRWLEASVSEAVSIFDSFKNLSDCLKSEEIEHSVSTISKIKIFYDNTELKIEVSVLKFNKQRAEFLSESFGQAHYNFKIDDKKNVVKTIHKNTSFKSENNQVFIVTRLPRGSIDALLAEKDAR